MGVYFLTEVVTEEIGQFPVRVIVLDIGTSTYHVLFFDGDVSHVGRAA